MKSDLDIVMQFKKHKGASQSGLSQQYQNTRECQMFYAGDIMAYRDSIQFQDPGGRKQRAMVQFNKVKPYVNAVKGFMAQNRRKVSYAARIQAETVQQLYSDYANALADYVRSNTNADQVETQQDGDMLICGYGAVETAMTYGIGHATTDPNGEILMGRLDPLYLGWDPHAKETNLLDARWVYYQRDYALEDALTLFSGSTPEVFDGAGMDDADETSGSGEIGEGGYHWYARGGRYNVIKEVGVDWADEPGQLVRVYFYQWFAYQCFYRAENPLFAMPALTAEEALERTELLAACERIAAEGAEDEENSDLFRFDPRAETLTFDEAIKEKLEALFGDRLEAFEFRRKVYYTAVISGNHVFTKFLSPCQKGFSVQFKTGDYDSKNHIWTGMVNAMKEPVLYYNKALTELMFIIGANSKGGVMYEKGTIEDVQKFEQNYAKTDAAIEVNEGALAEGRIKPKREGFMTTGYESVIQLSDASISDVNGIDRSFLGSSENRQESGVLQKRRIRQVVSTLACYFDSITLYQKEQARLLLDFLRIYAENNDGGLFRILGPDGRARFLQIAADKLVEDYDVSLQEAVTSPEDKQEQATLLTAIGDKLLQVGDMASAKAVYALALKYIAISGDDAQKIMGILMPTTPPIDPAYVQKLEQQVAQLSNAASQADIKKKLSDALLNMAKIDDLDTKALNIRAQAASTLETAKEANMKSTILAHAMGVGAQPDQPGGMHGAR